MAMRKVVRMQSKGSLKGNVKVFENGEIKNCWRRERKHGGVEEEWCLWALSSSTNLSSLLLA
jgi:hypothetical protein